MTYGKMAILYMKKGSQIAKMQPNNTLADIFVCFRRPGYLMTDTEDRLYGDFYDHDYHIHAINTIILITFRNLIA